MPSDAGSEGEALLVNANMVREAPESDLSNLTGSKHEGSLQVKLEAAEDNGPKEKKPEWNVVIRTHKVEGHEYCRPMFQPRDDFYDRADSRTVFQSGNTVPEVENATQSEAEVQPLDRVQDRKEDMDEKNASVKTAQGELTELHLDGNVDSQLYGSSAPPAIKQNEEIAETVASVQSAIGNPLHRTILKWIQKCILRAAGTLPIELESSLNIASKTELEFLYPHFPCPAPDMAVVYGDTSGPTYFPLAIKICDRQELADYIDDQACFAKWVKATRTTMTMFIMVNEDETQLHSSDSPNVDKLDTTDFSIVGEYGPTTLNGVVWVREILSCCVFTSVEDFNTERPSMRGHIVRTTREHSALLSVGMYGKMMTDLCSLLHRTS